MAITGGSLVDANGDALTSQLNGDQQALDVGVNVNGIQVDPRDIRALVPATDSINVQDITGTISLPTGASTEAKQDTGNASLASIDGKLNSLGQKASAASTPVVLASDQTSIPVVSEVAKGTLTNRSGTTSGTANTSTEIIPANANRKYLIIQNVSSAIIWINFGGAATTSQPSFQLSIGATFAMEGNFVSTEAVHAISSKSSMGFTAKEA